MFGRQGLLPIDLDGGEPTLSDMEETRTTDVDNLQCLAVIAEQRQQNLVAAKQNILQAQQKQKSVYDRRHGTGNKIQVDDLVFGRTLKERKEQEGNLIQDSWGHFWSLANMGCQLCCSKKMAGMLGK